MFMLKNCKMRKFILFAGTLLTILAGMKATAQTDPHFSQYYAYPMWLNPGLTGAIDEDYRVTAIYRNQYGNISTPFSTPGVSADVKTNKNAAFGLNVMNQSAGTGGYNYLNAYASFAYTGVRFGADGNQRISMGLSMGLINRRFDPSKFQTGDQWTGGGGYNPGGGSSDVLARTSAMAFDAGVGIMYYDATPDKKANVFLGVSAFHLNQPSDPFITGGTSDKMPVRYTGHGGVRIAISDEASITPNVLYMRQGNVDEKMIGAYVQYRVNETLDFLIGANYRYKDAYVPYVGFYYNSFLLGASYDVNASDLGKMTGNANSFEISLSFMGRKSHKGEAVPFVCPRL